MNQFGFATPPRLRAGDRIGVLAPSSGASARFPHVYRLGLQRLRDVFGLEPVEFPTTQRDQHYLAAHPEARAADIHTAFADPGIKAVIATIGGEDQIKVIKYLDMDLLRSHPKIFLGFSDNTHLHLALWNCRVVSYYGGSLMTQFAMQGRMHEYTVDYVRRALFEERIGQVHPSAAWTDFDFDWADASTLDQERPLEPNPGWTWHSADGRTVTGRLWGGCLESLDFQLRVGKYLPPLDDLDGIILFLETSEEMPSADSVWRVLTGMGERGILARCQALLVGRPRTRCLGVEPAEGRAAYSADQRRMITTVLSEYAPGAPIVFGLDIGHTDPQLLVPSGGLAEVDTAARTITFL